MNLAKTLTHQVYYEAGCQSVAGHWSGEGSVRQDTGHNTVDYTVRVYMHLGTLTWQNLL